MDRSDDGWCVCVCVRERERERERGKSVRATRYTAANRYIYIYRCPVEFSVICNFWEWFWGLSSLPRIQSSTRLGSHTTREKELCVRHRD